MSVKIKDNTVKIIVNTDSNINLALRKMLDDIDKEAMPKTPRKTGELRKDILKSVIGKKGKIKWGMNYALYQEKKLFSHYTTAGTGPHYAENAVNKVVNNADKYFKNGIVK